MEMMNGLKNSAIYYHGPRLLVRQAPPYRLPLLCCLILLSGFTVKPTFIAFSLEEYYLEILN
ncbi:hypothetical protein T05_4246, partial [Trichinella murrelli]